MATKIKNEKRCSRHLCPSSSRHFTPIDWIFVLMLQEKYESFYRNLKGSIRYKLPDNEDGSHVPTIPMRLSSHISDANDVVKKGFLIKKGKYCCHMKIFLCSSAVSHGTQYSISILCIHLTVKAAFHSEISHRARSHDAMYYCSVIWFPEQKKKLKNLLEGNVLLLLFSQCDQKKMHKHRRKSISNYLC